MSSESTSPKQQEDETRRLEEWLEQHNASVQAQFASWLRRGLVAFVILGITNTFALIGFGVLLDKQSDLSADIQAQRYDTLVQFCQDTNDRNSKVNQEIDQAVAQQPDAEQKANEEGTAAFRLIISAAVPYTENCTEEARNLVKGE